MMCDDRAVVPAEGSGFAAGRVVRPGEEGVVSRPGLFGRLAAAGRVAVVSAPAGSGKTVLLRSWIGASGLGGRAAGVAVEAGERDGQRFWLSVVGALRGTSAGSGLVRALTAAPELDGWAVVERLLKDLARLDERVWLVVDDVHELGSAEARRQLELLLMRGPEELRFVLATRRGVRLGLHRLRLEGELTEIRGGDLRFSLAEAGELFRAGGVELPDSALGMLHARTEGWVAGLRLAALSLAGHEDPGRFAAEFSGSERTVAEYLVAEVLERQSERVRRLLLVTSVLDRVNGELADLLAGGAAGSGCCRSWRRPTRSWCRWTRRGRGSGTTGCSRTCCGWSCGVPCRVRLPGCTGRPGGGWRTAGSRWRRSGMPRRRGTGRWRCGCWPGTGRGCCWTGRPARRMSCWPGSRPGSPWRMRSWRR